MRAKKFRKKLVPLDWSEISMRAPPPRGRARSSSDSARDRCTEKKRVARTVAASGLPEAIVRSRRQSSSRNGRPSFAMRSVRNAAAPLFLPPLPPFSLAALPSAYGARSSEMVTVRAPASSAFWISSRRQKNSAA